MSDNFEYNIRSDFVNLQYLPDLQSIFSNWTLVLKKLKFNFILFTSIFQKIEKL
jgi:hypothetical protein